MASHELITTSWGAALTASKVDQNGETHIITPCDVAVTTKEGTQKCPLRVVGGTILCKYKTDMHTGLVLGQGEAQCPMQRGPIRVGVKPLNGK